MKQGGLRCGWKKAWLCFFDKQKSPKSPVSFISYLLKCVLEKASIYSYIGFQVFLASLLIFSPFFFLFFPFLKICASTHMHNHNFMTHVW